MASDASLAAAALGLAGAMLQSAPTGVRTVTAEQAMATHRAATSIGPDPCRAGADADDEIVVCGRRESSYAVPLYREPVALQRDGSSTAAGALATARETSASCHARGETCTAPLVVLTIPVGKRANKAVRIGID